MLWPWIRPRRVAAMDKALVLRFGTRAVDQMAMDRGLGAALALDNPVGQWLGSQRLWTSRKSAIGTC